ncbi:MAG TPA: alpha/beta fold hydrolase [Trebonia sp.]|jgi:carboxylesterase|nr:alpha/beta fold hydrolase [Trebonia sp.]
MSSASSTAGQQPVLPGAEPFSSDGGPVGVLVCHGFTGSPRTVRPWAEHLAAAGLTVRAPRLPGHGTVWQDLAKTGWRDWYAVAEETFHDLHVRCEQVFVAGISMGGCLALRLAQTQADKVKGVVLVNPSLASDTKLLAVAPLLKYLIRSVSGVGGDIKKPGAAEGTYNRVPVAAAATLPDMWRTTAAGLPGVRQPLLVFRSAVDHVVGPRSMRVLTTARPDADVRQLADSYHVATLDNDAPAIFAGSLEFIKRHAGFPAEGAGSSPADASPEQRA